MNGSIEIRYQKFLVLLYMLCLQIGENLSISFCYIESGCVSIKKSPKYIVIDVESPSYFEEFGFDRNDPTKIKNLLKKNSFQYSFGEYIKEI